MANQWWAVKVTVPHTTGIIYYIQGGNAQQAAETYPGSTLLGGPYASLSAAETAFPGGSAGSTAITPGLPPPTSSNAPANPLSGLAAAGSFFSQLGQANTWIRVAEVLAGLLLLAIGVAKLTHAVPVATTIAKAVA